MMNKIRALQFSNSENSKGTSFNTTQNNTETVVTNTNEKNPEFHMERTLTLKIQNLNTFNLNDVLKDTIIWVQKTVMFHSSFKSFNWISTVLLMLKDSTITDQFTLCRS